jgi:hypothetical protein
MFRISTSYQPQILTVSLLLLSSATSASSQEKTAKQIAQATFPSTVLLTTQDSAGQPLLLGSGFFVAGHVIATNFHVIRGAAKGYGRLVGHKLGFSIIGVVGVDKGRDLALLSVDVKAPPLRLADSGSAEVGDNVYAVGNPEGLEGTFSQGLISGIRQRDSDAILQITAPISPGSSGGPVLNSKGEVVGVAVSTCTEGQNLNFAVPVAYLTQLLNNRKPLSGLSQLDPSPPAAKSSVLEGIGGDSREGLVLGQFLWDPHSNDLFSFSIRNQLSEPIRRVKCVVTFYDRNKQPVDYQVLQFDDIIPPGLAKRVKGNPLDSSVSYIVESDGRGFWSVPRRAEDPNSGAIEFRVMDFVIAK